ncbi:MAG: ABC transporter substrate-binding protein [Gammaproteobacteria bacterium AqS3]|nr:ABC transporter substrate-binding protein [Gammaproteobacteria bacterium AqS3]
MIPSTTRLSMTHLSPFARTCLPALLLFAALAAGPSRAQEHPAYQVMSQAVDELFDTIESSSGQPDEAVDRTIREQLSRNIAFEAITRRILGKQFESASPEQVERAVQLVRDLMLGTYVSLLREVKRSQIHLLPMGKSDAKESNAVVRSKVRLESGMLLDINFLMRPDSQDQWQLHNIQTVTDSGRKINLVKLFQRQMQLAFSASGSDLSATLDSLERSMSERP